MSNGHLFVIAAPSGAGKTTIVKAVTQKLSAIATSISHTTRPKREGEQDGIDYHFVDRNTFIAMRDADDFVEHAEVFTNFYGTSKSWLNQRISSGDDVILEIDWQGAQQVRKIFPDSTGIFIIPPSKSILLDRLRGRGTDSEDVIAKRTAEAVIEMSHYNEFDYLVINKDLDVAIQEVCSIITSFRLKTDRQYNKQPELLTELLD